MKYDFSGYATRNDLKCSDGRTIRAGAFKECSGKVVPLVWQHQHDDPMNVLGHALLEERDDGVYAYCSFNETEPAKQAKSLVLHGDVNQLSIYANKLVQKSGDVLHGAIREVSLVIAGANPGAMIDNVGMAHGEDGETDEAVIYNDDFIDNLGGEFEDSVEHTDEDKDEEVIEHADSEDKQEEKKMAEDSGKEKTVQDVIDTMNEEQKKVMMYLVGVAAEKGGAKETDDEGEEDMKHNVFDGSDEYTGSADQAELTHSQIETIISDGKKFGSLRDSFLAHADDYGIKDIDWLFPEAKTFTDKPEFISRKMEWVSTVMSGVHKSPFSRIKSMFADITEDEARAKGYIKGNLKKEEVFSLLKRTTTPTTIYKKQKLDRDDIIDITDFDVVAWIKAEMRVMLDEEIARAILVGDGRLSSDDDKINEDNIRPIWKEADLFCIKKEVTVGADADADATAKNFIRAAIKSRKDYRGSGNPVLFTTEDFLTDMLLLEDSIGHKLYKTEGELATALRVSKVVTVPVMENLTRTVTKSGQAYTNTLMGIIVNLNDYNVGADKGGAISMFDDFDIDYNQQKYLIETRCSGALTKPYSAIVLEKSVQGAG